MLYELLRKNVDKRDIRLLSLGANFFIKPDHESEVKFIETDNYLREELGDFSYSRLMPNLIDPRTIW